MLQFESSRVLDFCSAGVQVEVARCSSTDRYMSVAVLLTLSLVDVYHILIVCGHRYAVDVALISASCTPALTS